MIEGRFFDIGGKLQKVHFADGDYALIGDGVRKQIIQTSEIDHGAERTDDLGLKNFNHRVQIFKRDASEKETMEFLNAMLHHCLEITRRWATPISLVGESDDPNSKIAPTTFDEALGYWKRATAYLDQYQEDGESEPFLVVSVALEGDLFVNRLQPHVDVSLDSDESIQHELEKVISIHPRVIHLNDSDLVGTDRVDFDIVPSPDTED